jgi:hypothetical protein
MRSIWLKYLLILSCIYWLLARTIAQRWRAYKIRSSTEDTLRNVLNTWSLVIFCRILSNLHEKVTCKFRDWKEEATECQCRLGISSRRQINVRGIKLWNAVGCTRFPKWDVCSMPVRWVLVMFTRSRSARVTNMKLSRERNSFLPTCGLFHT